MTNGHSALLAVDGTERYGGIGAELNRKGDYPTVVGIVPGGPADLQGLLDVSDKIIGVGPTNNQVIDVVGWPLSDVIALLRGEIDSEVILRVIPKDGHIDKPKLITIVRGKIELIETPLERTVKAITDAAEAGDAKAQLELALLFAAGKGVRASDEQYIHWTKKSATNGFADAQFELGVLFSNGSMGLELDYHRSFFWLEKAAQQGHATAQNNLAIAYKNGNGVAQDTDASVFWYKKSAAQGYSLAQTNLGWLYMNGGDLEQDYAIAYDLHSKSADQGDAMGQSNLGFCYETGVGVVKNLDKAFQLYKQSAEQGNARGQANLAAAYSGGRGTAENKETSFYWYKKSAEQGDPMGVHGAGFALYWGHGVEQNQSAGINWFIKSAEQGFLLSQSQLGYAYFWGDGVAKDASAAFKWNTIAAEQGNVLSQERLGDIFYWGEGVQKDTSQSYKWYLMAAAQGHHSSEHKVGQAYSFGHGVTADDSTAAYWYTKAAQGGYDKAQFNLGIAYGQGLGVKINSKSGFDWLKKAAEQGYLNAQYLVGLAYMVGDGVLPDPKESIAWLTKAANNGHADAKNSLGLAYEAGDGVSQNKGKALGLFSEAAKKGNPEAAFNLGLATSYGDRKNTSTSLEYLKRAYKQGHHSAGYRVAIQHLEQKSGFYFPMAAYNILQELVVISKSDSVTSTSFALLGYMHANGLHVEKDVREALKYFEKLEPQNINSSAFELIVPTLHTILTPKQSQRYNPHLVTYLDEFCGSELNELDSKGFIENSVWPILRSITTGDEDFVTRCFDRHISSVLELENYQLAAERYQVGVPGLIGKNEEETFNYMLMAAESGVSVEQSDAMNMVGNFHREGYGTARSSSDARLWYQKAADAGSSSALNTLGLAHERGLLGYEIDLKTAFDYYQKAYEQDQECYLCMTNLGRMYQEGSVDADPSMAKIMYTKAFSKGDLEAGNLLASLQARGLAGPKNIAAAKATFKKVLSGNIMYRVSVGEDQHKKETEKAREELAELGVGNKLDISLDLGDYHALVIGNGNYKNFDKLPSANKDASDVANVLEQEYGFEVELLLDGTREQIMASLNRFREELKKGDNFLLYYAGHGELDEYKKGYWLPVDAKKSDGGKWIGNNGLNSTLQRFKANNIILVADSCYAGAVFRGVQLIDVGENGVSDSSQSNDSLLQRLSNSRSRVALTSGGLQPVVDGLGLSGNSVFAESFIRALKQNSDTIKALDIFTMVRQRVVPITGNEGIKQTPEFGPLAASGHEGGDFIFERVSR